jgi:hypothetical protein
MMMATTENLIMMTTMMSNDNKDNDGKENVDDG